MGGAPGEEQINKYIFSGLNRDVAEAGRNVMQWLYRDVAEAVLYSGLYNNGLKPFPMLYSRLYSNGLKPFTILHSELYRDLSDTFHNVI